MVRGSDEEDLSCSGVNFCVLHAVWDALNKAGKKHRELLSEDLT